MNAEIFQLTVHDVYKSQVVRVLTKNRNNKEKIATIQTCFTIEITNNKQFTPFNI